MDLTAELCASRELSRRLLEAVPGAVLVVDAAGQIVQANALAVEMAELSFDSATGLYRSNFASPLFHEDGSPMPIEECPVTRCLMTGQPQPPLTLGTVRSDGSRAWGICTAVPLTNSETGRLTGAVSTTIDITARKLAEESQQRHLALLRNVTEGSDDFIFMKDLEFRYLMVNTPAARYVGMTPEEMVGRDDFALFPAAVAQVFRQGDMKLLETGQPVSHEDVLEFNGTLRTFLTSKALCRDDQGRAIGIVGIAHDISDLKRSEAQWKETCDQLRVSHEQRGSALAEASQSLRDEVDRRRRSEEARDRLIGVIEATTDFVGMATVEGITLYINQAGRQLVGVGLEDDVRGRAITDFHPPWAQQVIMEQALPAALAAGVWAGETALLAGDGREIPISQLVLAHRDAEGQVSYLSTLARDISEKKRQEATLQQSEARLRALVENTTDAIWSVDEQHRLVIFNQMFVDRFHEVIGVTPRVGQGPHDLLPREQALVWTRLLDRTLGGEQFSESMQFTIGGELRDYDVLFSPIISGTKITGATIFSRDVTPLKRILSTLEADHEFKKRMLEAHDRDRKLTAFEIHDGLVQDLSAAKMYVEALQVQYAGTDAPHRENFQRIIAILRRSIEEGRRIMSGLCPPVIDEFGVVSGIEFLVGEFRGPDAPTVTFTHAVNFDRLDPLLESTLFRIAQEGLNNVRRHSNTRRAEVSLTQRDGMIHLEIRDWGSGFDLARVSKNRYGVRGIEERTRLFGGSCSIQTSPGKGTRIVVDLPLHQSVSTPLTLSPV